MKKQYGNEAELKIPTDGVISEILRENRNVFSGWVAEKLISLKELNNELYIFSSTYMRMTKENDALKKELNHLKGIFTEEEIKDKCREYAINIRKSMCGKTYEEIKSMCENSRLSLNILVDNSSEIIPAPESVLIDRYVEEAVKLYRNSFGG